MLLAQRATLRTSLSRNAARVHRSRAARPRSPLARRSHAARAPHRRHSLATRAPHRRASCATWPPLARPSCASGRWPLVCCADAAPRHSGALLGAPAPEPHGGFESMLQRAATAQWAAASRKTQTQHLGRGRPLRPEPPTRCWGGRVLYGPIMRCGGTLGSGDARCGALLGCGHPMGCGDLMCGGDPMGSGDSMPGGDLMGEHDHIAEANVDWLALCSVGCEPIPAEPETLHV